MSLEHKSQRCDLKKRMRRLKNCFSLLKDDVTTPRRLRNLRGKIPRLVTGTSTTSLAIMHQGLFGAPFTDLIVNGEIPHRLSSIFSYLELEGFLSLFLHLFFFSIYLKIILAITISLLHKASRWRRRNLCYFSIKQQS